MAGHRVFIGVGHGGSDPGAVANGLKESEVNLVMALACREELVRYGVEVGISREREEDDRLAEEIAECNAFAPDCAVEIHNNAGGGDGFEVYVQTGSCQEQSRALAQAIEQQVVALGQNSRGLKTKKNQSGSDWFGWLRQVNYPAVLLEGAFLDNAADAAIIDSIEKQQAFGRAYARGILSFLGIVPNPETGAGEASDAVSASGEDGGDDLSGEIRKLCGLMETLAQLVLELIKEAEKMLAADSGGSVTEMLQKLREICSQAEAPARQIPEMTKEE